MKLYGIQNCDSVKRARAALTGAGIPFDFHDFRRDGLPAERLDAWLDATGWQTLLNRRGTTWRQLGDAERASVIDRASARAALLARPALLKRPVVEWPDGRITVGPEAVLETAARR